MTAPAVIVDVVVIFVDKLIVPEVIVPTVERFDNEVKVVFDVAVMFPAVVAFVAVVRDKLSKANYDYG